MRQKSTKARHKFVILMLLSSDVSDRLLGVGKVCKLAISLCIFYEFDHGLFTVTLKCFQLQLTEIQDWNSWRSPQTIPHPSKIKTHKEKLIGISHESKDSSDTIRKFLRLARETREITNLNDYKKHIEFYGFIIKAENEKFYLNKSPAVHNIPGPVKVSDSLCNK